MLPPAPPAISAPQDDAIGLTADRLDLDEKTGVLTATGHVVLTREGILLTAESLRFDRKRGQGTVSGPLTLTSPAAQLTAERATFDLNARVAELYAFRGRWGTRAQLWGEHLKLMEDRVELDHAFASPCDHEDPDLMVTASRFTFYHRSADRELVAAGVGVRAAGLQLFTLPELRTRLDEKQRPGFDNWSFPSIGYDVYQGLMAATRAEFTLGENSRGAIPVVVSTGRGLSAGIEHVLGTGQGELFNAVRYETPWATNQGGIRVLNSYVLFGRDGSRYELAADYRANLNEQPVHRLPEATWNLPFQDWGGLLSVQPEVRAGWLTEPNMDISAPRFRATAPFSTSPFTGLRGYQTWISGSPFANHYGSYGHFVGAYLDWNHREVFGPELAFTQLLETVRTDGQTPFIHDRLIPADRIRLGVEKSWGPRLFTGVTGTWSRLYNTGPLIVEDVGVTAQYRWNCFLLGVTLRPLVWGVSTQFQLTE